jgi:cell division protein FtsN
MAKKLIRRKLNHDGGSVSRQLLVVLICFLFGFLTATWVDCSRLRPWLAAFITQDSSVFPKTRSPVEMANLPKPKLEFYTLLTSDQPDKAKNAAASLPLVAQKPITNAPVVSAPGPLNLTVVKNEPTQVPVTAALPQLAAKQLPKSLDSARGGYLVQIASFKNKQEALKMQASLRQKGIVVSLAVMNQQQINWYRVVMGPFASRGEALQAQSSVARTEHIKGMVRKMDA